MSKSKNESTGKHSQPGPGGPKMLPNSHEIVINLAAGGHDHSPHTSSKWAMLKGSQRSLYMQGDNDGNGASIASEGAAPIIRIRSADQQNPVTLKVEDKLEVKGAATVNTGGHSDGDFTINSSGGGSSFKVVVGQNQIILHSGAKICWGSASGPCIITGNGAPDAETNPVFAPPGSLYLNISSTAGKKLYVKESGGSTENGWVAK